jgi:hypothetical protein
MNVFNTPTITHVPAQPGWFYLQPIEEENSEKIISVDQVPVLAWLIHTEESFLNTSPTTSVTAITVEGQVEDWAVFENPLGKYSTQNGDYFETFEEVISYLNSDGVND